MNRSLHRDVVRLSDGVFRVYDRRGYAEDKGGYIVVRSGEFIRCECHHAYQGNWCSHLVAVCKFMELPSVAAGEVIF